MMSKITILHLSDVHFKRKEKETTPTFRQDVTTKMIGAIQQHLDKHHAAPDVVESVFGQHVGLFDPAVAV